MTRKAKRKKKRPAAVRYYVVHEQATGIGTWIVSRRPGIVSRTAEVLAECVTQGAAIRQAREFITDEVRLGRVCSLRIQRARDRRWREERTYPRRADPKRTKG